MPLERSLPIRQSMPNTGKPSGGCEACRRMKVKCGEERPTCSRCEKVGRDCRYREPRDIFLSMNDASKVRAENPPPRRVNKRAASLPQSGEAKKPRSRSPQRRTETPHALSNVQSPVSGRSGHSSDSPAKQMSLHGAVLARPASVDWEEAAISFYLSEFVMRPSENADQPGYLDCLPDLLQEATDAAHLRDALKSVALSIMGNRSCMEQLSVQAQRSYGRALASVNSALNDATTQAADATLVSLILLGQYEVISGDRPDQLLRSSHSEGQAALLALRGTEQFETERGRALFRFAQSGIQLGSISSPDLRFWWKGQAPESLFQGPLGWRFHDVSHQIFETRQATQALLRDPAWLNDWDTCLLKIVVTQGDLLSRADVLTDTCRTEPHSWFWNAQAINAPSPRSPDAPNSSNTPLPRYAYVFTTLVIASNLLYFWTLRAKLIDGLLDSIALLSSDTFQSLPPELHPKTLRARLSAAIDDGCATLPFLFGEVDYASSFQPGGFAKSILAYMALWPLTVLSGLSGIDSARRNWLLARLTQIGTVYGIRQALHLRDWRMQTTTATSASGSISSASLHGAVGAVASGSAPPAMAATTMSSISRVDLRIDGPSSAVERESVPLDEPPEWWFPEL